MTGQVIRVDFKAKRRIADNDAPATAPTTISQINQQKLDFFSETVQHSKTSTICFPSHSGVQLPEHLMSQMQVMIDWSHKFGSVDFEYDEEGVRGTLRFNGDPCYVSIPWDAISEIRNAQNINQKRRWASQQIRIVPATPQIVQNLTPEKLAQLHQVLFSQQFQQPVPPVEPIKVQEEKHESPIESPPGMAPSFVGRIFGKVRGFANKFFSRPIQERKSIPGEELDI